MKKKNARSKGRFFAVLAVAGLIGVATYAFTATNTVADSIAGEGAGDISGIDVSNVHYNLNALDPSLIDSYTFTVDPSAPVQIMAKLVSGQATYDGCVPVALVVTCTPTLPVAVTSADELRVIAAD